MELAAISLLGMCVFGVCALVAGFFGGAVFITASYHIKMRNGLVPFLDSSGVVAWRKPEYPMPKNDGPTKRVFRSES